MCHALGRRQPIDSLFFNLADRSLPIEPLVIILDNMRARDGIEGWLYLLIELVRGVALEWKTC